MKSAKAVREKMKEEKGWHTALELSRIETEIGAASRGGKYGVSCYLPNEEIREIIRGYGYSVGMMSGRDMFPSNTYYIYWGDRS